MSSSHLYSKFIGIFIIIILVVRKIILATFLKLFQNLKPIFNSILYSILFYYFILKFLKIINDNTLALITECISYLYNGILADRNKRLLVHYRK